jgi:hypothetical protein
MVKEALYNIVQRSELLPLILCITKFFFEEMKPKVYIFHKMYAYWGSK